MDLSVLDIPEKKAKQLKNKGLDSVEALISLYPKRYETHDNYHKISSLGQHIGENVSVIGQLENVKANYHKGFVSAYLRDDTGVLRLIWFGQPYLAQTLHTRQSYLIYGQVSFDPTYGFSIKSPSFMSDKPKEALKQITSIYPKIPGMSAEYLSGCIKKAVDFYTVYGNTEDEIDSEMREHLDVVGKVEAMQKIHFPADKKDIDMAQKRIVVEQLVPFCIGMSKKRHNARHVSCAPINDKAAIKLMQDIAMLLPYELTDDQKRVVTEMYLSMRDGTRLDALVQGDVGCGKTVVAMLLAASIVASGYQVAVMAPTTVLAEQHYADFKETFEPFGISVVYLASGLRKKELASMMKSIEDGSASIIVGTNAVVSETVHFAALGMAIVDEEHRFGVKQRNALIKKASEGVNSLSMSATPIPRSLAIAMYGDSTKIYSIHTMPAGRKPVTTVVYSDEFKTYDAMLRQIDAGHQCYVVCPCIEQSDSDVMAGVDSVEETEKKMMDYYDKKCSGKVRLATITGRMKKADVQNLIQAFKNKEYDVLLSTTIVEVGVNVPNATVMVVKNAERFGLAQLHQLRGRVGRSEFSSFCVLLSNEKNNQRLSVMAETTDGFKIAEADLKTRGAGNLIGREQSGFQKNLELMVTYPDVYKAIMDEFDRIFEEKRRYDRYFETCEEDDDNIPA